jgi:hypothetical protein
VGESWVDQPWWELGTAAEHRLERLFEVLRPDVGRSLWRQAWVRMEAKAMAGEYPPEVARMVLAQIMRGDAPHRVEGRTRPPVREAG